MNYLVNAFHQEKEITVHTLATRNLIDADDVKNITLKFINENSFNKIINVAYLENFSTTEILEILEKHFNKTAKISPTEVLLYFYLLKMGYENDRYDFKISDVELGKELGLTRKTIKSTKEKLKNLGLIQFQSKNGFPSHYRLLLNYSIEIEPDISIKKEESTIIKKDQKREILEIFESILSAQNSVEVVKEVEINSDIKASSETTEKQKLEWEQVQKQKQEQQNLKNNKIPSLDEFIEYAKSLEGYEAELDLNISKKYESWIII
jgi:DNA-binding Lrp family transcriptional regulator